MDEEGETVEGLAGVGGSSGYHVVLLHSRASHDDRTLGPSLPERGHAMMW